jgi:hypothetical protein
MSPSISSSLEEQAPVTAERGGFEPPTPVDYRRNGLLEAAAFNQSLLPLHPPQTV